MKINKIEKNKNLKFFTEILIPKLNLKYKISLINEKSNHYRINHKEKTVDFYPFRRRLCFLDYNEWITIQKNEEIQERIECYLDLQ